MPVWSPENSVRRKCIESALISEVSTLNLDPVSCNISSLMTDLCDHNAEYLQKKKNIKSDKIKYKKKA